MFVNGKSIGWIQNGEFRESVFTTPTIFLFCRYICNDTRITSYNVCYTKLLRIGKKQEWELVEIFADEAKSGTQTKKRDEFLRMMKECENGNIDIIITSQSQGLQEILLIVLKPSGGSQGVEAAAGSSRSKSRA